MAPQGSSSTHATTGSRWPDWCAIRSPSQSETSGSCRSTKREFHNLPDEDRRRLRRLQRHYLEEWVHVLLGLRPELSDVEARTAVHAAIGAIQSVAYFNSGLSTERVTALLSDAAHACPGAAVMQVHDRMTSVLEYPTGSSGRQSWPRSARCRRMRFPRFSELCERAVRLYRESQPAPDVSPAGRAAERPSRDLRNWVRQDEADRGERHDRPSTDMLEENRRLVRENAELRRVNEVLRAASAYFASEIGPTRRWS